MVSLNAINYINVYIVDKGKKIFVNYIIRMDYSWDLYYSSINVLVNLRHI